ncbi:PQQ-binding-like beta-propeller repeat protein [Candidatus Uabimicrobium sp. HlEnr_7]|uniref:serine/threonine-protein kinase n=1 Tax=Candidatus Uabimicrobium helgolandensis TaxID=3095367 RepID=UPI003556F59B
MATAKDKEFARVTITLGFIKQPLLQNLWKQYEKQNYYQKTLSFAQWLVQNKFLSLAQVATIEHQIINKASLSDTSDFGSDLDQQIKSALEDEEYYAPSKDRMQVINDVDFGEIPSVVSTVYDDESISQQRLFENTDTKNQKIPETKVNNNLPDIPQTLFEGNAPNSNENISKGNIPHTLFEGNSPLQKDIPHTFFEGNAPNTGEGISKGNIPQTLFEGNSPLQKDIPHTFFEGNAPNTGEGISKGNIPQTLFEGNAPLQNIPQTLFEGNSPLQENIPQTLFEGNAPLQNIPQTLYDNDPSMPKVQHDHFFDNPFSLPKNMVPATQVAGSNNNIDEAQAELVHAEFASETISSTIKPGKKLGRYDIIGEIGRGGMGKVYKVYDPTTEKIIALKVLLSTGERETEKMGRFLREAFLSSKFDHPNIVAVHDIGNEDGNIFFTMDFIEGRTLDQLIKERSLTRRQLVELMIKVTQAVAHAHGKKIIHRDLKPENIILDKNKEPMVMDFGLAKIVNEDSKLSKSGMIIGTVHYMPPEQADGLVKELDERSDTYALGAILYELITHRTPFTGSSFSEVIDQILYQDPPPPSKVAKRVPRDLEKICLKAIEKEKEDRYQSAEDLAADLTSFSRGQKINIKSPFWPKIIRSTKKSLRSRKIKYIASFITLFTICIFLTISVLRSKQKNLTSQDIKFSLVNSKKSKQNTFSVGENIYLMINWNSKKQIQKNKVYLEFYGKKLESYQSNYTQQQSINELLTNVKLLLETPGQYQLVSKISIGKLQKEKVLSFTIKPLDIPIKKQVVMFRNDLQRTGAIKKEISYDREFKVHSQFKIPYGVWAAPIEENGVLYIATAQGAVHAYNYINRTKLWSFQVEKTKVSKNNKNKLNIYSSPTIAGKFLYFGSENGNFYALDKNTGEEIWKFSTGGFISSSPLVNEHLCYFGSSDSKLYCLNRFSGELIWSFVAQGSIFCSPAYQDEVIYFGDLKSYFYAIDAKFGHQIWKDKASGKIMSTPTVIANRVYFTNNSGTIYAKQTKTGITEWTYDGKNPILFASPTIVDDLLFCGSFNGLHIVNTRSGKRIHFIRTKDRIYSSPIYTKNKIVYCTTNDGKILILNTNNLKKFKYLDVRKNKPQVILYASPTISNGYLFVASAKGHIFIFK